MNILRTIAYILVLIGAINWGLIGFMNLDLVALIFGEITLMSRIVYSIVGISGIILLLTTYKDIFYRENY
ncbi:DUF378 domain-containing protein [bacterium]|nr:DUF378 domain-containing protein [bacterium]